MEKLTAVVLFRTVLLLAGLNAALAQEEPANVADGETLKLSPSFSESISSLLWKHEGNMVIEWVKDKLDKTYGNFQNRTNMDTTTGVLEIMKMTAADAGVYTVEINKKDQGRRYRVNVMKKVSKPSVEFQPLTCPNSGRCGLSCEGDTEGAGTVEYSWKIGEGPWEKGEKTMSITRESNPHDKTFTCKIENPVSVEESEPEDNPFYRGEVPVPQSKVGPIAAGILVPLIALILIGVGFWKRDTIKKLIGINGPAAADNVEGNSEGVKLTGAVVNSNEASPPAADNVEGNPEGVKLTGAVVNSNEASPPAAGNGANAPSENSTEPHEADTPAESPSP